MNHQLWNRVGARVIALAFVIAGVTACHDKISDVSSGSRAATAPTPSAQVIGTAPAQPTGDPAGTTAVAPNTSDVTKQQEIAGKPAEGDNHSYSTVAPSTPQKSENSDPQQQPDRSKK
jgi:hypothetical protein